ncbi:uncharacterized protein LOC119337798 isoform X2 [Triticum dicoccoides]|uniref:uncharacterized protein LOC119337798 isoform X2 n=1 Tax=Triticum dicoccoides TaxID=85692 RepID=UPI001891495F|nr:uncharacterized protein LOC119337798 isoform X2 [Triticum dicoccoides]
MDLESLERILDGREKPTNLSFELLKSITENFSDDREIGHGGFATVYKGTLPNGNVAVKRIRNSHSINEALFYREVDSLLNIEHKNVVRFLGFCASTDQAAIQIEGSKQHIYAELRERLLCFEYISNGSLQKYITDELRGLEWNTRYKIIRGICEGLHHLHKEKQIYHMDLKPDNILLDNDMVPKITDFGLSRLDEKSKTMSEQRHGSLGYCAPEYLHQGKMSFKSDMYSLGVIIIELVTGQKAIPSNNNNVLRRWRHRWKKNENGTCLVYQEVAKCLEIGLLCKEIDPFKRPYIWDMIHVIRETEGANEKTSNAYEHTFGQISPYSEDDMLGIEPLQLHFPFELNKQMSCALQLTNETGSYIAFNIKNTSPLAYCIQPQKSIMPPRSMCSVEITMQLQGKTPGYMHRASELIVWSTKVNDCLAVEDITTNWFINEAVNVVDDVNLDVVFDVCEPQEASKETSVTIQPLIEITDDAVGVFFCMDAHQTEPLIITGDRFGDVQIWNSDTQKVVASIKVSDEIVHTVKFIARKQWLVAVSHDCFVHVYKYQKELQKVTSFKVQDYGVAWCSLNVHPTQPYVLSGCSEKIKLWDWDQNWNCIQIFEGHWNSINELKFNPEDTNSFASASWDNTIKVWSVDSPIFKYTLSGHSDNVNCLDFFKRDGQQYLISGSEDMTAKIWNLQKKECVYTLEHERDVYSVFAHPSLPVLITGDDRGAVCVWSSTDFKLKTKLEVSRLRFRIFGFACLTGSERVAVAHYDGVSLIKIGDEGQAVVKDATRIPYQL